MNSKSSNKNPSSVLAQHIYSKVAVVLKNGWEFKGKLVRCNGQMNVFLQDATEYENGRPIANYGKVLLRGNNIFYIGRLR